jgi:hypothetical protein
MGGVEGRVRRSGEVAEGEDWEGDGEEVGEEEEERREAA